MSLDIDTLEALRRQHPAWRLLAADSAALVVSFLHSVFVRPNRRVIHQAELAAALDFGAGYGFDALAQAGLNDAARRLLDDLRCRRLREEPLRLEQERIRFGWVERAVADLAS